MMIKIEAIIREEKFEEVKDALAALDVHGITCYQVMGCGTQRGLKEYVRGHQEIEIQMLPKIKFEIVVSSEEWEQKTIDAIRKIIYGKHWRRKIFSYELRTRIRTNETGYDAIQPE
ncbi:MAG: P-II family nitrogen regulator [Ruminococcus sp.]